MTYSAKDLEEIPEDRINLYIEAQKLASMYPPEIQEIPLMRHIWIGSCWLQDKLKELNASQEDNKKVQLKYGEYTFFCITHRKDVAYEVAARLLNQYVSGEKIEVDPRILNSADQIIEIRSAQIERKIKDQNE